MAETGIKQQIIDAVIQKTEDDSMKAVHIARLIKELGINRNTFYYYFGSKYDVAMYVFRTDLAAMLANYIPEEELIYAPVDSERSDESLPYYMRREIGAHSLDFSDFFKCLARCVMGRQGFYSKLFNNKEPEFKTMIEDLYRPVVENDLRFVLGGRYMPDETFDFLASFFLGDIYAIPSYHLANSSQSEILLDDRMNPFWNMPYETLTLELQRHPINRIRR